MFKKQLLNKVLLLRNMSKKSKAKSVKPAALPASNKATGPITLKNESVEIRIYAKPGAKQNAITDITDEFINVQINAPPVEGSANTELVKYMAAILGLSKSHVELDRGHKSKEKVLKISGSSLEDIKMKIANEVK